MPSIWDSAFISQYKAALWPFSTTGTSFGCSSAYNLIILGFMPDSRNALALANFKYKMRPIINSEVNTVAKAAKKKVKKAAKKK